MRSGSSGLLLYRLHPCILALARDSESHIVQELTHREYTCPQQQPQEASHLAEQAQQLKRRPLLNTLIAQLFEVDVHLQKVVPEKDYVPA